MSRFSDAQPEFPGAPPPGPSLIGNFGGQLPLDSPQGQVFRGVIKAYDKERGWGHIQSALAHATYGKDIFVPASALPLGQEGVVGDEIDFSVNMTPKGPQASKVSFVNKPNVNPFNAADTAGGRFLGVIRSFDMAKGWGHIDCRESRAIYNRDIFLLRSKLNGAEVAPGNQVDFAVEIGPKGPQAKDVCLVDYGPSLADAVKYRGAPY